MMNNRYLLITLVLGLNILPLIIDGSETPDLPGNGTSMNTTYRPDQQLKTKLNVSKIMAKRRRRIMARKKFARTLQKLTIPFLDTIDRVPKFLNDLKGTDENNSSQITNKTKLNSHIKGKDEAPKQYGQLLSVLIQYACKNHRFPMAFI
ncbi:hypothetical protein KR032_007859 [Drosophila birchii]|nr:hypothetical protein KR032_007859 [Drosophila birchii]